MRAWIIRKQRERGRGRGHNRRRLGAVALAAVGCPLAACTHTHLVGSSRTLSLGVTEYRVTPQSARASAGMLTIVVHNYGRLTHDLVVSENGQTVGATKPVWPGQSAQLALTLAPGKYLMASTILSDQALGAYGTLTVTR